MKFETIQINSGKEKGIKTQTPTHVLKLGWRPGRGADSACLAWPFSS
jgi:hypothetical protein